MVKLLNYNQLSQIRIIKRLIMKVKKVKLKINVEFICNLLIITLLVFYRRN